MITAITGILFGLCLFIVPLWAYRRGLKDGLALTQHQTLPPIANPVEVVQRYRDRHADQAAAKIAEDQLSQGMANILAYDGTPQKGGET